jgi:hypothetical protein
MRVHERSERQRARLAQRARPLAAHRALLARRRLVLLRPPPRRLAAPALRAAALALLRAAVALRRCVHGHEGQATGEAVLDVQRVARELGKVRVLQAGHVAKAAHLQAGQQVPQDLRARLSRWQPHASDEVPDFTKCTRLRHVDLGFHCIIISDVLGQATISETGGSRACCMLSGDSWHHPPGKMTHACSKTDSNPTFRAAVVQPSHA